MKQKVARFVILNLPIHAYARIFFLFVVCLLIGVCVYISVPFLFLVLLVCIPGLICAEWVLLSVVEFDSDGICWHRPLGKRHCILWSDALCAGEISLKIGATQPKLLYFSTTPVDMKKICSSNTYPKLTDSFVFITVQPAIYEAVTQYAPPAVQKKLTKEITDKEETVGSGRMASHAVSPVRKVTSVVSFVAIILMALYGIYTEDVRLLIAAFLLSLVMAVQLYVSMTRK